MELPPAMKGFIKHWPCPAGHVQDKKGKCRPLMVNYKSNPLFNDCFKKNSVFSDHVCIDVITKTGAK